MLTNPHFACYFIHRFKNAPTVDARLRKRSREAMLVDVLRARGEEARRSGTALLVVLEDVHWLDALSHDLLEVIGHAITEVSTRKPSWIYPWDANGRRSRRIVLQCRTKILKTE
ncbi:MAG: hypothetical protein H0T73_13615 [Ardenticatenales bacterium]|nr:hypothetical protein [Ardenticatenales bacterium]